MTLRRICRASLLFSIIAAHVIAADPQSAAGAGDPITAALAEQVVPPAAVLEEVRRFAETRVVRLPEATSRDAWDRTARQLRQDVLDQVIFRGRAARWRDAACRVEWLDNVPATAPAQTNAGYSIRKLRFEALPGLWLPALLYVPDKLEGKMPVSLAVNGHAREGKSIEYKQIRCINQAKRGIIVLNAEWYGMGQLAHDNYSHARANQLDLCGATAIAPFYLSLKRSLDILLSLPNADPARVAVSGLSGGGWQTIFISGLDERVTLANPVAGYSSFLTRAREPSDLGDTEQTPCDLATVADYLHLTAMRAPRPTLLTFNSKDDCCFRSTHALQPLLDGARPFFALYSAAGNLRAHVNDEPGTHNYEKDNREAFYRMLGDHFFAGQSFDWHEIPCRDEVRTADQLSVPLPEGNADFNTLARALMADLPHAGADRTRLRQVVRFRAYDDVKVDSSPTAGPDGLQITSLRFKLDSDWTLPATRVASPSARGVTVLIADAGRKAITAHVRRLVDAGQQVIAVDPFYFGGSAIPERDYLYALLVAAVGERPLGIQAGQVAAVARWARGIAGGQPVSLAAVGPRTSTIALIAAAIETEAIGAVELHEPLTSLKQVIERNEPVTAMPELFCYALLEHVDIKDLIAMVSPRPVRGL